MTENRRAWVLQYPQYKIVGSCSGGDISIAVGSGCGVFAKTAEADLNQLFESLIGPRRLAGVGE